MDKFATLEPVKLYSPPTSTGSRFLGRGSARNAVVQNLIGRLPADLHILVLTHLAIPDFPAYSRASRVLADLSRDERVWEPKWKGLGVDRFKFGPVLDALEAREKNKPPVPEDDFGDFTSASAAQGTGLGSLFATSLSLHPSVLLSSGKQTFRQKFIRAHNILKPLLPSLLSPPHLVLSSLFTSPSTSLHEESQILHLLANYLSPSIRPVKNHDILYSSIRAAIDRFQANLLTAFDVADEKHDESVMREAALSSWEVWEGHFSSIDIPVAEWEMGRTWCEKREILYDQGNWKPLDNFTKDNHLDFDAMDDFMNHILSAIRAEGEIAMRVFPPKSYVLLSFAERVATEVVGDYVTPLLSKAREISNETFLKAAAATFKETWRLADALQQLDKSGTFVSPTQAEDVVYRMFEPYMDEYLDEEVESVKQAFEIISRNWEQKLSAQDGAEKNAASNSASAARFLWSHNPAQVKRNVLASFTDVLLLPVTIVPRTVGAVGAVLTQGGSAAVQGIAMLNPQRWVAQSSSTIGTNGSVKRSASYAPNIEKEDTEMVFEVGDDLDDDYLEGEKKIETSTFTQSSVSSTSRTTLDIPQSSSSASSVRSISPSPSKKEAAFDEMELLLSLDVSLELIHANRDAIKRLETFASYPGSYGHRVRDTIEEVFILLLLSMGERHIKPGFDRATEQMRTYKPAEHEETTSVAPLLQFFELVHVGDTIQSMVQVYFDKELARHIDKTDFLNAVVREKKRFENILDDSVAAGMNAGTEVLMNQVEHIILIRTQAREYYPQEDAPLELSPTRGCLEAIACLDMHCKLLKGSTSKEVLEVFYQEVGIRLLGILHRHIKRQIISLSGGFKIIADLNAYYSFISSLRVQSIAADFSNLKMLGHVYVVEDAKDLAQIVRDVTRYGGAYRPEDIYEFIQRRADWKKIEKTVDKTMYNLSFKEDCVIS